MTLKKERISHKGSSFETHTKEEEEKKKDKKREKENEKKRHIHPIGITQSFVKSIREPFVIGNENCNTSSNGDLCIEEGKEERKREGKN